MASMESTTNTNTTDLTDEFTGCPACDATGQRGRGRCRTCHGHGRLSFEQLAGWPEGWFEMTPAEQHAAVAARSLNNG